MTSSDWQADVALNDALPFADFVWSLRNLDVPVGVHDLQAVAKLLRRWPGTSRDELRDALAALLARRPSDLPRIRKAFDEWFPVEEPAVETAPTPVKRRRRKIAPWLAGFALALIAVVIALSWPRPGPQKPTALPATRVEPPPQKTFEIDRTQPPQQPPTPPEPRRPAARYPWLVSVLAMLVVVAGAAELRARRGRRKAARRAAGEDLAAMKGPHRYDPVVTPAGPSLPPSWVKDAATIIGRGVEERAASEALDVDETLRETLRAGLRPVLVFQPPPRRAAILVLEDTAPAMRPWGAKVEFLLTELNREGIAVERWFFESDPSLVAPERHGRSIRLERLADTRADRALLVVSGGESLNAVLHKRKRLTATLRRWSYRSWLNPIPNSRLWSAALRLAPMNVWPLTGNGLQRAAWEIAAGPYATPSTRADERRRDVTADDVERLKCLIALVPYPTVALAEELRRRYCRDVPEEVVLFLAAEGTLRGERLLLPDEEVRRLLAAQRHDAPVRESRVRQYLLEVLRGSRPAEGSVADLRWQLDRALQEVHASAAMGSEAPPESVARLEQLADGPLAQEVRNAAALTGAPTAVQQRVEKAASRYAVRAQRLAPRWAAPGVMFVLLAGVLAMLAYRLAAPMAAGKGEAIPHLLGAYRLEYEFHPDPATGQFGIMHIKREKAAAPANPSLRIRNVLIAATAASVPVKEANSGAWWRVEGQLDQGNFALSGDLWVPKMRFAPADGTIHIRLLNGNTEIPSLVRLTSPDRGSEISVQSSTDTAIPSGEWQINVDVRGFKPNIVPTTVTPGQRKSVYVPLEPTAPASTYGQLLITAPGATPSDIVVTSANERQAGMWTLGRPVRVPVGLYVISLTGDFYEPVQRQAVVLAGQVIEVAFPQRVPRYGVVIVYSNPSGAQITAHGAFRFAGFDPNGDYKIVAPPGQLELSAETQLGVGKETVVIVAGERTRTIINVIEARSCVPSVVYFPTNRNWMVTFRDCASAPTLAVDDTVILTIGGRECLGKVSHFTKAGLRIANITLPAEVTFFTPAECTPVDAATYRLEAGGVTFDLTMARRSGGSSPP